MLHIEPNLDFLKKSACDSNGSLMITRIPCLKYIYASLYFGFIVQSISTPTIILKAKVIFSKTI